MEPTLEVMDAGQDILQAPAEPGVHDDGIMPCRPIAQIQADAGKDILQVPGEPGAHDDGVMPYRPIAQVQAIGTEDHEVSGALPARGPWKSDGTEGENFDPTVEPHSEVTSTSAGAPPVSSDTVLPGDVCDQQQRASKQLHLEAVFKASFMDVVSDHSPEEMPVPAAVVTRSQAVAGERKPRPRCLKTTDFVGASVNRGTLVKALGEDPTLQKLFESAKDGGVMDHRYGQSKFFLSNGLLMRRTL